MSNWKIPVIFSGFGAGVSLLAGIIGGNPFGVILLRLILSALVCGGLGLGVNLIVKKFLPELSANPPVARMEPGEEVDIVIDEDIPLAQEATGRQSPEPEESLEQMEPVDEEEASELTMSVDEEAGQPDVGEEGEEAEEDASELTMSVDEEAGQPDVGEEGEEVEEDALVLEDVDTEQDSTPEEFVPGIAAAQVADFEDLDTLPDIDTFGSSQQDSAPPTSPSPKDSKVQEVVRDQDPENLARAVRTFMKKDQ